MIGFWIVAAIIATLRTWSPTTGDLLYIRWGFMGCLALATLLAGSIVLPAP